MSIKIHVNNQELTDVKTLQMSLEFRAGLDTRDYNGLQVSLTRNCGDRANAPADQHAFTVMRGENNRAGIRPVPMTIDLYDDNANMSIGVWKVGEAFVENYSILDEGARLTERTSLRANKVTYTKHGGPAIEQIDLTL